jgi:hypothetical protein
MQTKEVITNSGYRERSELNIGWAHHIGPMSPPRNSSFVIHHFGQSPAALLLFSLSGEEGDAAAAGIDSLPLLFREGVFYFTNSQEPCKIFVCEFFLPEPEALPEESWRASLIPQSSLCHRRGS